MGLSNLQFTDQNSSRNLMIVGFAIYMGEQDRSGLWEGSGKGSGEGSGEGGWGKGAAGLTFRLA